jgi:hypothetical protein
VLNREQIHAFCEVAAEPVISSSMTERWMWSAKLVDICAPGCKSCHKYLAHGQRDTVLSACDWMIDLTEHATVYWAQRGNVYLRRVNP